MNSKQNPTFEIVNKDFVRVCSIDNSIDFKTQIVRLEIFVDDLTKPKYIKSCNELLDVNQVTTKTVEFATNYENMSIVAYSDDESVNLNHLKIVGF